MPHRYVNAQRCVRPTDQHRHRRLPLGPAGRTERTKTGGIRGCRPPSPPCGSVAQTARCPGYECACGTGSSDRCAGRSLLPRHCASGQIAMAQQRTTARKRAAAAGTNRLRVLIMRFDDVRGPRLFSRRSRRGGSSARFRARPTRDCRSRAWSSRPWRPRTACESSHQPPVRDRSRP